MHVGSKNKSLMTKMGIIQIKNKKKNLKDGDNYLNMSGRGFEAWTYEIIHDCTRVLKLNTAIR